MTANKDFKRVVRERMAKTGETYTEARQALTKENLTRIDELVSDYNESGQDHIDREHLIVEAKNLATSMDCSAMNGEAFYKVFWPIPAKERLAALQAFLTQQDLSPKEYCWAGEQQLIYMALAAMHDQGTSEDVVKAHEEFFEWVQNNLDDAGQTQAFCTPEVWWCWDQIGRQSEMLNRMEVSLSTVPAIQDNKHDRLFIARNLLMYTARAGNDDDVTRFQNFLSGILDEPGELRDGSDRLKWDGILQQTPLIAAGDDGEKAEVATEACAVWVRDQNGKADWLMGEVAALCLF